jgi:hypothetical protein
LRSCDLRVNEWQVVVTFADHTPLAAIDGVVRAVLVDPGAEAGLAQSQSHHSTAAKWDDAP